MRPSNLQFRLLITILTLMSTELMAQTVIQNYSTMTVYTSVPKSFEPSSRKPFSLPQYVPASNNAGSSFQFQNIHVPTITESEIAIEGMKKAFVQKNFKEVIALSEKVETQWKGIDYNEALIGSYEKLDMIKEIAIEAYMRDLVFNEIQLYNTVAYALTINSVYDKAENYFALGKAYDFSTTSNDIIFWRSYLSLETGQLQVAKAGYEHLIRVGYKDVSVYYLCSEIYMRLYTSASAKDDRLLKQAIKNLTKSMTLAPNKSDALAMRAEARFLLNDYDSCIIDVNEFMKTDTLIHMWEKKAASKMQLKDYKGSMDEYSSILKTFPGNYNSYISMGYIKIIQNDFDGGLEDLNKAAELAKLINNSIPGSIYEYWAYLFFLKKEYNNSLSYLKDTSVYHHNTFRHNFLMAACMIKTESGTKEEICNHLYECYELENNDPNFSLKNVDDLISSNCDVLKGWTTLKNSKYKFSISFPVGDINNPKGYFKNGDRYSISEKGVGEFIVDVFKSQEELDENCRNLKLYYPEEIHKIKFNGIDAYKLSYIQFDVKHEILLFQKGNLFYSLESTANPVKANAFFNSFIYKE